MIDSQSPPGCPRKADLSIRKELLVSLGLPLGAATIASRRAPEGDILVVRLATPGLLSPDRRPASFQGLPIVYEVVRPPRIGHP